MLFGPQLLTLGEVEALGQCDELCLELPSCKRIAPNTFRSYFELPYEPEDILADGYIFYRKQLSLPETSRQVDRVPELRQQIEETLPLISLSSAARRETLTAPVLLDVARYCQCQLRIESPLVVNDRLKGTLDYLLRAKRQRLVIDGIRRCSHNW